MGLLINSKYKDIKLSDMPTKEKDEIYTLLMCLGRVDKNDWNKTPIQLSNKIAFDFI